MYDYNMTIRCKNVLKKNTLIDAFSRIKFLFISCLKTLAL